MALFSTAMTEILSALARFGLAGVWLYSGIVKLLNPVESRQAIQAYELLPDNAVGLVAVGLPTLEVILGLLLLLGVFLRPVAIIFRDYYRGLYRRFALRMGARSTD